MNVVKCENSHFFDSDKHDKCPHCGSVAKNVEKPKAEKLSADKIALSINNFKLKLSYGYFPIHNIEYHNGMVKFYNRINPRDGGRHYPEHFFDEFELILNDEQINDLNKIIYSLEFVKDSLVETPKIFNDGEPSKSYNKLITDDGITYLIKNARLLISFFEEICDFPEIDTIIHNHNIQCKCEFHSYVSLYQLKSNQGSDKLKFLGLKCQKCNYQEIYDFLIPNEPEEQGEIISYEVTTVDEMNNNVSVNRYTPTEFKMFRNKDFLKNYFSTLDIYPETIRLFIESQNKDILIGKKSFFVGRSSDCDIQFDESLVSRIHVIFYYNDGTWFIEDLSSKNGVWLNDVKLEPMKMYRLKENDIIDLAHSEKLIFFKDNEDTEVLLI